MTTSLDELTQLAAFAHVVHARSFSLAAKRLGIAKSAVSSKIAKLEAEMGVKLLLRTTRKLDLTEAGATLYERCARIVQEADEAVASVAGLADSPVGVLKVNAPVSLGTQMIAPNLVPFCAKYPAIRVELTLTDQYVDVMSGAFDVTLRVAQSLDPNLYAKKLSTERLVVLGAPSYLDKHGRPARPSDLVLHNCLRYALITASDEWRFSVDGKEQVVRVTGNLVSNDGAALRSAAVAGLGLVILPTFMVQHELASGALEILLGDYFPGERRIYAVHAHGRHAPAKVRVFIDHLAATAPHHTGRSPTTPRTPGR